MLLVVAIRAYCRESNSQQAAETCTDHGPFSSVWEIILGLVQKNIVATVAETKQKLEGFSCAKVPKLCT